MSKTLIIGGGGYVGAELISHLVKKNFYIYCVDKFIYQNSSLIKNSTAYIRISGPRMPSTTLRMPGSAPI